MPGRSREEVLSRHGKCFALPAALLDGVLRFLARLSLRNGYIRTPHPTIISIFDSVIPSLSQARHVLDNML